MLNDRYDAPIRLVACWNRGHHECQDLEDWVISRWSAIVASGRLSPHSAALRTVVPIVIGFVLAFPYFFDLGAEEFHGDETHWTTSSQEAYRLVGFGELFDTEWTDEFYFRSQPQVGKLLIGVTLAAFGLTSDRKLDDEGVPLRQVREYDWQLSPQVNAVAGNVPEKLTLTVGRLPGALAGWLTALMIWWAARRAGLGTAGLVAAVLLSSHPLWLAHARRVGMDALSLMFGLSCGLLVIHGSLMRSRSWLTWVGAGLVGAFAVGTKYTGAYTALAGIVPLAYAFRRGPTGPRAMVIAGLPLAASVAATVFIALNPSLYPHPVRGIAESIEFFQTQSAHMRATYPVFSDPLLVALEIVDRAIWWTGYPEVTDTTMPHALRPGSYGTPIVAIAAAVALLGLVARDAWRPRYASTRWRILVTVALGWFATTFVFLAASLPIWWERWHLALIPPLCLLAGAGLALAGPRVGAVVAFCQYVAALSIGPSYLNHGFETLVTLPWSVGAHLIAVAVVVGRVVIGYLAPTRLSLDRARAHDPQVSLGLESGS